MCFFRVKAFLILAIIIVKIVYLGFLASYASRVALIILSLLFSFSFSIRYRVGIRFRFRFFKYLLYNRILVLLVFLYSKLKLLLSVGWCSIYSLFIGLSRIFRSLIDISRSLILVEFGKISRLVELGRLLRYKIDISRNFRLVDPSGFFRF